MNDAASFDAIMQCNLLEVFCEAVGAAIIVTNKLDEISFASIRLLHLFPIRESALAPGGRARDLYSALYDAGLRFGLDERSTTGRADWIADRIACAWKERIDKVEQTGPDRWMRIVSRRFSSGLGFVVIQDVSEQKKKELLLRSEQERVKLTEEILDTLAIGVGVKDRNLNLVAVNQELCRLLGKPQDALLGRGCWEFLSPEQAGRIEQMDWQLLSSGQQSCDHISHITPEGVPITLERKARRLGKPGSHYIVVSVTEVEPSNTLNPTSQAQVERVAAHASEASLAPASAHPTLHNVLVLADAKRYDQALKLALRSHGIDICFIRDPLELAAFLPEAKAAGVAIDLAVIAYDFDAVAFNVAAAAELNFRMLPAGADESSVMAEILNALPPARTPVEAPSIEPPGLPVEDLVSLFSEVPATKHAGIDVLGVEDNPVNRMVLEQILGSLSLSYHIAASAREGIAKYSEEAPRLVLADLTLPDLSPYEFALNLRKVDASALIIGLLPTDTEDNHHRAKVAGFDRSLPKPLNAELLGTLIAELLNKDADQPKGPAS
jgi:PAS domain S-box-containing protein